MFSAAPRRERSLLELRAVWSRLPEAHERVAARLRVFVLNWDPLGWMRDAFEPCATATGDGDAFELVLYAPLTDAPRLGDLCRSVLDVGVSQELLLVSGAYAQLAFTGTAPDLMSAVGALSALEEPGFERATGDWAPIGLGAIQDLVQAQFGPVNLDRSAVAFEPVAEPAPRCPACTGQRFGFPGELADQQPVMCPPHAERAAEIVEDRLARAEASNPDGWRAIADASCALSTPTYGLPLDLLDRLDEAIGRVEPTGDELRADATTVLELAGELRGRLDDFESLAEDWFTRDWMIELPWLLARCGMTEDAVRVADAFAELDRDQRSLYAGDAAVILAEAGHADAALARVNANLDAFPRDIWTRVHAGDVHQQLDDPSAAEQAFRRAAVLADAHGDRQDASIIAQRLATLLATIPGRESEAAEAATIGRRALAAEHGQRIASAPGRNEPCPCGSGRNFKKCCGA